MKATGFHDDDDDEESYLSDGSSSFEILVTAPDTGVGEDNSNATATPVVGIVFESSDEVMMVVVVPDDHDDGKEVLLDDSNTTTTTATAKKKKKGKVDDENESSVRDSEFDFDDSSDSEDEGFIKTELKTNPFDMQILRDSMQAGSVAVDSIVDKDVVFVLGKTGTGKSTLIQGIAGRELRSAVYEMTRYGAVVRKDVFEADNPLPGFEIGHAKKSMTKSINAYHRGGKSNFVYIDAPGFEDTDGHEIDIATSVMLNKIAKKCRSLRIVVLINFASLLEDRGGAIRAVLKLTRTFVQDFDKEKQSFMFLFTHTDEIHEIRDSLERAKERLSHEIIQTIDGTTAEDVLEVLKFLRKSLQRGFPFVSVFHPIKSDFNHLVSSIESKLMPLKALSLSGCSGLTISSQFALASELNKLLQRLRADLKGAERQHAIHRVKESIMLLRYFGLYIETQDMREALLVANTLLSGFVENLMVSVETEITRGVKLDEAFCSTNAAYLKSSMVQLQAFSDAFPDELCLRRTKMKMAEGAKTLLDGLLQEQGLTLNVFMQQLNKLHALSGVFEEFTSSYEDARRHIAQLFHTKIRDVDAFDSGELQSTQFYKLDTLFENISILHSIDGHLKDELYIHGIDVNTVKDTQLASKALIIAELDSWRHILDYETQMDEDVLQSLTQRARALEHLCTLSETTLASSCLVEITSIVQDEIAARVTELFSAECSKLKKQCQTSDSPMLLDQYKFSMIRSTSESFSSMQSDCWSLIPAHYHSLIEILKSFLKKKSGELHEMSQSAGNHGIRQGGREVQALEAFDSLQWFDQFLPNKDRFIVNCSISYKTAYKDKIESVVREVSKEIDAITRNHDSHLFEISASNLKPLLSDLRQIGYFASVLANPDFSTFETKVMSELRELVKNLGRISSEVLAGSWKKSHEKQDRNTLQTVTREINECLCKISSLKSIDSVCDESLSVILANIESVFTAFNTQSQVAFDAEKRFKKKAYCLYAISIFQEFPKMARYFQDFGQLKDQVRKTITAEALRIEILVSETSDWDEIDSSLTVFQRATILDEFTSSEATSRLRPLLKQQEQKQSQVDELLADLIEKQDFRGILDFLGPYASSKDQLKKKKFDQFCNTIFQSLYKIVEEVHRLLNFEVSDRTTRSIHDSLQTLLHAQIELDRDSKGKARILRLKRENLELQKRVNEKAYKILTSILLATTKPDYIILGTNIEIITTFAGPMKEFLTEGNRKKLHRALTQFADIEEDLSSRSEKFFSSSFEISDPIRSALCSLKTASERNTPALKAFSELYRQVSTTLTSRLNEFVRSVEDGILDARCYDDAIIVVGVLDRELKSGLLDHVDADIMNFNSALLLEEWRQAERTSTISLAFEGKKAEDVIKEWSKLLNNLQPSGFSLIRVAYKWIKGTSYKKLTRAMEDKVRIWFDRGISSLKNRNFSTVEDCISILGLISHHIGKHIKMAAPQHQELKKKSLYSFINLCEQVHLSMGGKRKKEFEGLFHEYCDFAVSVSSVVSTVPGTRQLSETSQLLCEALTADINELHTTVGSFDFYEIKLKVENLKSFGGCITDQSVFLYEEIKSCKGNEVDKWLGDLKKLCLEYFSHGRDYSLITHYAALGVPPSASVQEIKKAFRSKARIFHPDKCGSMSDGGRKFIRIKDAADILSEGVDVSRYSKEVPFGDLIRSIGDKLRKKVRQSLEEQDYKFVKRILFNLGSLKELDNLVSPALESEAIRAEIFSLVKNHVQKARTEVDSNWAERKYKALNENITDLKLMEDSFKGFPDIFSSTWNNGIVDSIEREIESLGKRARDYVRDKTAAQTSVDDFRRCIIQMGSVLVELPTFKEFTKNIMNDALESCLCSDWGYSYLFELGLSLQNGEETDTEDDNRVGQSIVQEFSHFKEVMTMVWNEETSQKPAEHTVEGITGYVLSSSGEEPFDIDRKQLFKSFEAFDTQYKSFLGQFIKPESDLAALVQMTVSTANQLKPSSCEHGWGEDLKRELPRILAGVFAVFTILKSGASFNRLGAGPANSKLGQKLLKKPHNIQVLTLLRMFGCGSTSRNSLDSELMQIRTGEGKSMILGAASVMLALLGFRARCVCYSEYLSARDYGLFRDVFEIFKLADYIKYSKITTLSEDMTAAKGDIRALTTSLLYSQSATKTPSKSLRQVLHDGNVASGGSQIRQGTSEPGTGSEEYARDTPTSRTVNNEVTLSLPNNAGTLAVDGGNINQLDTKNKALDQNKKGGMPCRSGQREEVLLVDEVDVFFGSEFYGQTYNQVTQIREPEVVEILEYIWSIHKRGGRRPRLADVQKLSAYNQLVKKIPEYLFAIDNEISLMVHQVRQVDDAPYHLDRNTDRIGYKVMDTISYDVTYGYRTVFAYLKEADCEHLKNKEGTLSNVLTMPISCGQFSYAKIAPARILGVSGTLQVMGEYEKAVLAKYGINSFAFIPSVYGESNFQFDKAGEGICIDSNLSDHFHSITEQVRTMTEKKRAIIIFFPDNARMKEFTDSAFYRKLGRQKKLLTEDMDATDREFIISKAATSGQITVCSAVFGRGTDFFCKDERVQENGGVHVIQAFLSTEHSEEIQIQGRTARQGKKGSYQMLLLESDLDVQFGLPKGEKDTIAKGDRYKWLCSLRDRYHAECCQSTEENLAAATERDLMTHKYFDALLTSESRAARGLFKELYFAMKKPPIPPEIDIDLAFAVDVTGSMGPYARAASDAMKTLVDGDSSIVSKLKASFPETSFKIRWGILGFRDIDDQANQFCESTWQGGCHFTENVGDSVRYLETICKKASGGGDLAEDIFGAIDRCTGWDSTGDWTSRIKFMMLLTDAPAHGMLPSFSTNVANADSYSKCHPSGLTKEKVVGNLLAKDVDLFMCSFNPAATSKTEAELSKAYLNHPANSEQCEISAIPMVTQQADQDVSLVGGYGKHIIFVLDQSGSMCNDWAGVVSAYNSYISRRRQDQNESDFVSVVQFATNATVAVNMKPIAEAPTSLGFSGGDTWFSPAADSACKIAVTTPSSHVPTIVFMSDGSAYDATMAANAFSLLNQEIRNKTGEDVELHVIAFGSGACKQQLNEIAQASGNGKLHTSAGSTELSNIFVGIAGEQDVSEILATEIGKRISEAVSDRVSLEYLG